jgi:hypothetical protein
VACGIAGISRNWFWITKSNFKNVQKFTPHKNTLFLHYRDKPVEFFYTSLAPKPFKFGLAFPHGRSPFRSVQSSSSPSFHAHIPEVQFYITYPPKLRSSCFSSFSWFALQWLLCRPSAIRSYMLKPGQSTYFNYSYNIWKLKCIINFLISFDSPRVFFRILLYVFPFPTSLRFFPFYSLWSIIRHQKSQFVVLYFRDLFSMNMFYISFWHMA